MNHRDSYTASEPHRTRMVETLTESGHLTSDAWHEAFGAIPREAFIPAFFRTVNGGWQAAPAELEPSADRLALIYQDESWVTEVDGRVWADETSPGEHVEGEPTSSSTMPSLMAAMIERLDICEGHRVLEVGTGTGYNTAILCHRLGDGAVASIEVDGNAAVRAAAALAGLGYRPKLVVGDGQEGIPQRAPFDRVITTCATKTVPHAWIAQTRPGGRILANLYTHPYGSAQVLLEVGEDGSAEDVFVDEQIGFMPAREDTDRDHWGPTPEALTDTAARHTRWGVDALSTWPTGFLASWVLGAVNHYLAWEGSPDHIVDPDTKSWAAFTVDDDQHLVAEGGPRSLWAEVEQLLTTWSADGHSGLEGFRLEVTPDGTHMVRDVKTGRAWTR